MNTAKPAFSQTRFRRFPAILAGLVAACGAPVLLHAQYGPSPPPPPPGEYAPEPLPPLEQQLAPIALYPDPVLGLILPASTEPGQIQAAAGFLEAGFDMHQLDMQVWIDPVKALAHYPDITRWLSDNIDWTRQIGAAFATEQGQVMDAIQDLRRRALQAGTLQSNPQQEVIDENGLVRIVPAQMDAIYIPRYDPDAVYYAGAPDSVIVWGNPWSAGPWLSFYPDWTRHSLWVGDWYDMSRHHGGWHAQFDFGGLGIAVGVGGRPGGREWHVPGDAPVLRFGGYHFDDRFSHPHLMDGTPGRDRYEQSHYGHYDEHRDDRRPDDRDHHYPENPPPNY